MTSRIDTNPITGDKLQTKPSTKEYRDGWDAIFGKAGYSTPPHLKPCPSKEGGCFCTGECMALKEKDTSASTD